MKWMAGFEIEPHVVSEYANAVEVDQFIGWLSGYFVPAA